MVARAHFAQPQSLDLARILGVVVGMVVTLGLSAMLAMPPTLKAAESLGGAGTAGYVKVQDLNRLPHLIINDCEGACWQPTVPLHVRLDPIAASQPAYPADAAGDNASGVVLLQLVVGIDGRVIEARLVHSSGDRRLDDAARQHVLHNWRFRPAMKNGEPVQAWGRVPIVFTLDGR